MKRIKHVVAKSFQRARKWVNTRNGLCRYWKQTANRKNRRLWKQAIAKGEDIYIHNIVNGCDLV